MKTILETLQPDQVTSRKELHELVNTLVKTMVPAVVQKNSFIINDVPKDIAISADEQVLSSIIGCMLRMMAGRVQDGCIRIVANTVDGFVVIQAKDNSGSHNGFITSDLQEAMLYVRRLGWYLSVAIGGETTTEISFCFPNVRKTVS